MTSSRFVASTMLVWCSLIGSLVGAAAPPPGRPVMPAAQVVPKDGFFFIQDTANAELAVATINRLKPAFVVVTGDLVNKPGDRAQIAEYRRVMRKINRRIPVYNVSGNHDVSNEPTGASLAAYRKLFGRDYYSFRQGSLYGIVLNSTLVHSPMNALDEYEQQSQWLRAELQRARTSDAKHVVTFVHHPPFLERRDEADQYFNLPRERREPLLKELQDAGVKLVASGHLHRATEGSDGGLQSVVTGPVGRPLGGSSGLRVFVVTDAAITHRYYSLAELPYKIAQQ